MAETTTESPYVTYKSEEIPVKPAAGVWRGPDPVSIPDRVTFFREQGFVILHNVLSSAELDELFAELDRIVENHRSLKSAREGFNPEQKQDAQRKGIAFRKLGGINDFSEAFARLLRHPNIMNTLHAIMGPTIQLYRDVVMMKPARVGREKPWHQDSVYWPWQPMNLVSAMTALDDSTPENGCLQIIPRSHLKEVQHLGDELRVDPDDNLQARTLYAPLKAGDTLLFHSLTLHASEPNLSDQDRRVVINSYKTPDLKYIGKPEGDRPCPLVSQR